MGAALGATRSTLRFTGDQELDIEQAALTASAGYRWSAHTTVRIAVGAVLDGALEADGRTHEIAPGLLAAVGVARQWQRGAWFATGTLGLAASRVTTAERGDAQRTALVATDLRVGVMAGRTFGPVSPYVLARGFGGPVMWTLDDDAVTGTDVYKHQLGGGVSITTSGGVGVTLDLSLVGERAASLGVTLPL